MFIKINLFYSIIDNKFIIFYSIKIMLLLSISVLLQFTFHFKKNYIYINNLFFRIKLNLILFFYKHGFLLYVFLIYVRLLLLVIFLINEYDLILHLNNFFSLKKAYCMDINHHRHLQQEHIEQIQRISEQNKIELLEFSKNNLDVYIGDKKCLYPTSYILKYYQPKSENIFILNNLNLNVEISIKEQENYIHSCLIYVKKINQLKMGLTLNAHYDICNDIVQKVENMRDCHTSGFTNNFIQFKKQDQNIKGTLSELQVAYQMPQVVISEIYGYLYPPKWCFYSQCFVGQLNEIHHLCVENIEEIQRIKNINFQNRYHYIGYYPSIKTKFGMDDSRNIFSSNIFITEKEFFNMTKDELFFFYKNNLINKKINNEKHGIDFFKNIFIKNPKIMEQNKISYTNSEELIVEKKAKLK